MTKLFSIQEKLIMQGKKGNSLMETLQRAIGFHETGNLSDAECLYEAILRAQPEEFDSRHQEALHYLGVLEAQQGRLQEAFRLIGHALSINPKDAKAHSNFGNVLQGLKRYEKALASYETALAINPGDANSWNSRGVALYELKRYEQALSGYDRALALRPDFAEAHNNRGNALLELKRPEEALACYDRALALKPDSAEFCHNRGNALLELKRPAQALACHDRALALNPDSANFYNSRGNALLELKRPEEALACYDRALALEPNSAEYCHNCGCALRDLGRLDDAVASYRRALEIKPDYAEAHSNLGVALKDIGRLDDAVASYRRALEIKPDYAEAHSNLGVALKDIGRLDDAVASYRRALEIKPDYAEAHSNLGSALRELGQLDDSVASCRRALAIKPDLAVAHSNLLFFLSQSEAVDARALFAEHCRFAEQFEAPLRANWPQHANSRDPERCLQVGFVSPDLRNHAVAFFIEPVLAHLSSYPQLSLHAYYNHVNEDAVTQRLRGYLTHWHSIVGLSNEVLANKIREDSIDILIDLSGHTAKHRLLTFARKPAPVQASWMGYPGTTGLRAMDYYLADRFFLPPGQFDSHFTEKIVRLPASAPFLPSKDAPPVNTLPAMGQGYVTFGSFNRPSKISRSVIALWSQLLRALPDSRMVLGGMPKEGKYDTLIEWFAQEGIARDRLNFQVSSGMGRYLSLHHQIDICLDTFPYSGGTTTCHAIWMGVPILTLAGSTPAGRPSASVLGHVGLEAFVAHDAADFVHKGLSWAGNLAALSDIRAGLRERFAKSTMGQPALVAQGLQRALRIMWQRWCDGLPPVALDVCDNLQKKQSSLV